MSQIALIFGGPSPEHDVSLVSAKNIYQVLKQTDHQPILIGVTKNKKWKLVEGTDLTQTNFSEPLNLENIGRVIHLCNKDNQVFAVCEDTNESIGPIDVAFPIIHGPYGEDGRLQEELNKIDLNFVGSDIEACVDSFDKVKTKKVATSINIPQVPYCEVLATVPTFAEIKEQLGRPIFIKPANMGSSLGISKVKNEQEYLAAIQTAQKYDSKVVIEQGLQAREIECAILQNGDHILVSGMGEIRPHHEFYSYEAKYLDPNGADLIIPAQLSGEVTQKIQRYAKDIFLKLQCRDYARVDFFLTEENEIYFNELNTHPGFTNISQFPMLWKQEGVEYKELILKLIQQAVER